MIDVSSFPERQPEFSQNHAPRKEKTEHRRLRRTIRHQTESAARKGKTYAAAGCGCAGSYSENGLFLRGRDTCTEGWGISDPCRFVRIEADKQPSSRKITILKFYYKYPIDRICSFATISSATPTKVSNHEGPAPLCPRRCNRAKRVGFSFFWRNTNGRYSKRRHRKQVGIRAELRQNPCHGHGNGGQPLQP